MNAGRTPVTMTVSVRVLVAVDLVICALIALSPLIVAVAVKPDLTGAALIDIAVERTAMGLIASIGLIDLGLLGWARFGAIAPVQILLFFCPVLAALFFAAWGFQ